MAAVTITGTIQNAAGSPVENVQVILTPQAPAPGGEEAIGGIGVTIAPVQVLTDAAGAFTATAIQGFRYRMQIKAINYDREFVAPSTGTVRFDLLFLVPSIETAADYDSCDVPAVAKVKLTVKADPINTVNERFDTIEVEKSTTGIGGAFVLDTTITLQAGEAFYTIERDADPSDYFRARFSHTNGDKGQYSAPKLADSEFEALVISVDELKELYLFGVDLTDDAGNPFPPRMFEHYIATATAWLEKELDIPIVAREFTEVQDHYAADYGRWGFFQLQNYPVVLPEGTDPTEPYSDTNPTPVSVSFQYPSQTEEVVIQDEWIVLVERGASGQIQIVPGQGNIADVLLIPGALMPMWSGAFGRVPGVWRFRYSAGFKPNKPAAEGGLPADLKHLIAMHASIGVFNIAGDLVAGAGIANISISVPGLNQNVGTTASATNAGFGARIGEYQKEIKAMIPNLKKFYGKGSRLVVV